VLRSGNFRRRFFDPAAMAAGLAVASTKVVCDGPGDQRAEDVKAATA
jgi:hypothetical protein